MRENAEREKQEAVRKRNEVLKQEQQAKEAAARQQEELARQRREAEERAKAARAEQEAWEQTKLDNTIAAYANFLTRYPESQFVTPAQAAKQKILRENAEREKQEAARRRSEALKQEQQAQEAAARQQEELARQRREAEEKDKAARAEQEAWEQTKINNTIAAYANFLSRYPESQFVAQAQAAQQKILRENAEREKQEAARRRSEALKQEQQAQEAAARQQEELARQKREAEAKAKAARVEQESWEQTKTDNTIAAYANFLTRYPESQFVAQAQAAQQKIVRETAEREKQAKEAEEKAQAIRVEQESWEQVKSDNTIAAYANYLTRYSEGRYVLLAQAAQQKIVRETAEREKLAQEAAALQQEELRQKRKAEEQAKAIRAEQESWEQAKSDNTIAAYANYLTKYPESQFVVQAQAAQQKISRDTAVAVAKTLFTLTVDGIIVDSQTALEWVVGPDENTNYSQAEKWVAACTVAGGGWRLPTMNELKILYKKGVEVRNMEQIFKTTGSFVWGEPKDWLSAWNFNFRNGSANWDSRYDSSNNRVFGVRSRPR